VRVCEEEEEEGKEEEELGAELYLRPERRARAWSPNAAP